MLAGTFKQILINNHDDRLGYTHTSILSSWCYGVWLITFVTFSPSVSSTLPLSSSSLTAALYMQANKTEMPKHCLKRKGT